MGPGREHRALVCWGGGDVTGVVAATKCLCISSTDEMMQVCVMHK